MERERQHAIVTTVGTSLLQYGADDGERAALVGTANRREGALTAAERTFLEARAAAGQRALAEGDAARASAEANALLALEAATRGTCHYLLHTDTAQGARAAALLAEWLAAREATVVPQVLMGLTAADGAAFARGIEALLAWSEATLPGLREQGRVTFNLTGGFKSVQAYLQTLGMFYADEVVYLFQGEGSGLIRIPRLPLAWDPEPLRRHAAAVARLAEGAILPRAELAGLPEVYLEIDERGDATLSEWGRVAWGLQKKEILAEHILEQPGLEASDSFRRDWERRRQPAERVALQEALARAAVRWAEGGLAALRADGGLLYEDLRDRGGIGHFRINDGLRASCRPEDGRLILRRWGAHDPVNNDG